MSKRVIDVACGSKMFWFDKHNPDVEFCDEILPLAPYPPLFGHRSGKNMNTHWLCFMKPKEERPLPEREENI